MENRDLSILMLSKERGKGSKIVQESNWKLKYP